MWSLSTVMMGVSRSMAIGCATLGLTILAPSAGLQAQGLPTVVVMKSALHTFTPGQGVRATVSELGTGLPAKVRIELRDRRNGLVTSSEGELRASSPVQLDFTVPAGELVQLSARIVILSRSALTTEPAAVLEEIGPDQLTVEPRTQCTGPPSGRDSAQTICGCPGWSVSSFVAGV